jgi:hypothetical protein
MLVSSLKIAAELTARKAVGIGGRDAGPCVGAIQWKPRKGSTSKKKSVASCQETENRFQGWGNAATINTLVDYASLHAVAD